MMEINVDKLIEEALKSKDAGMFESLLGDEALVSELFEKERDFFTRKKSNEKPSNCKSDEAEYILTHGSVSRRYLELKEEADGRYSEIEARLSADF